MSVGPAAGRDARGEHELRDIVEDEATAPARFDPEAPDSVSVIIPTYNRARCIRRAARSVLLQTHRNLELIIADDASTDRTEEIVRGLGDPRLVFVRQETNAGAGAARNLGLLQARGRFIAFHDSDDEWLLDKLERQMAFLSSLPQEYGAVFGSKLIYGRDLEHRRGADRVAIAPETGRNVKSGDLLDQLIKGNLISPQTLLLKSDVSAQVGGFDTRLKNNEDWEFMLRLSRITKIHFDPLPVAVDYMSPDSIQSSRHKAARSTILITRKHQDVLSRDRKSLSYWYFSAGRSLYKVGRVSSCQRAYIRSILLYPWRLKSWLALAQAWLQRWRSRSGQMVAPKT